jgi:hypothetical protein
MNRDGQTLFMADYDVSVSGQRLGVTEYADGTTITLAYEYDADGARPEDRQLWLDWVIAGLRILIRAHNR